MASDIVGYSSATDISLIDKPSSSDVTCILDSNGRTLGAKSNPNLSHDNRHDSLRKRAQSVTMLHRGPAYMLSSQLDILSTDDPNATIEEKQINGPSWEATGENTSMTMRQKLTLVSLALANYSSSLVFSIIAPFFPREAKMKGATDTEIGFIFGIYELSIFVFSPFYGRYISTLGPKFLYCTGIVVTGCASVLFGLINMCPPGPTFVALCFIIRVVEAVGAAAFVTASFTIVASKFKGRVATVIAGGFGLPFFVCGSFLIVAGLAAIPLIEIGPISAPRKRSLMKLLLIPDIVVMMVVVMVCAMSISFIDPTLEPHLSQFDLTPLLVGLMFIVIASLYTISAPLWGWFLDKKGHSREVVSLGIALISLSYVFLGPNPISNLPSKLWIVSIGLILLGLGIGAAIIPPFTACLRAAVKCGYEDNFQLYGLISGLFHSFWCSGAFIGPTLLGGVVMDHLGFQWTSAIVSCINLILLVVILSFMFLKRHWNKASIPVEQSNEADVILEDKTVA